MSGTVEQKQKVTTKRLPAVLRSRKHLEQQGVSFLAPGAKAPEPLPITDDGATFSMAQEVTWVDRFTFAVGRWDGTLSLFRFNDSPTSGPLVTRAASTPAMEGVQMIVWLHPRMFASSNDDKSLLLWSTEDGTWRDLQRTSFPFDAALGVANSGDVVVVENQRYLVVGHANGFVTTWLWQPESRRLELRRAVDLRSNSPTNPWRLHNIRGVAAFSQGAPGRVITGSEDGLLCVVDAIAGSVLSKTVYNSEAQRGINSVALFGSRLLVANCAVGQADSNLWSYEVDLASNEVRMCDRARLVVNAEAPQVFNFCTIWGKFASGACFFSSTEEGALWMGTVDGAGKMSPLGYRRATSPLGAALAYNRSGRLVLVAYDLHEYRTGGNERPDDHDNPERLTTV